MVKESNSNLASSSTISRFDPTHTCTPQTHRKQTKLVNTTAKGIFLLAYSLVCIAGCVQARMGGKGLEARGTCWAWGRHWKKSVCTSLAWDSAAVFKKHHSSSKQGTAPNHLNFQDESWDSHLWALVLTNMSPSAESEPFLCTMTASFHSNFLG